MCFIRYVTHALASFLLLVSGDRGTGKLVLDSTQVLRKIGVGSANEDAIGKLLTSKMDYGLSCAAKLGKKSAGTNR